MPTRLSRPATLAASALVLAFAAIACSSPTPGPAAPNAVVEQVIDGDTLVVRSGYRTENVRLIGIDTPEVAHHGQVGECFGAEATDRLTELVPVGSTVRLARDTEPRDVYDRLLAYVFAPDGTMVNLQLAVEGYADELAISPNLAMADAMAASVSVARHNRIGMWEHCAEAVASPG